MTCAGSGREKVLSSGSVSEPEEASLCVRAHGSFTGSTAISCEESMRAAFRMPARRRAARSAASASCCGVREMIFLADLECLAMPW